LITTICRRDIKVFSHSLSRIKKCINPRLIHVCTPDKDFELVLKAAHGHDNVTIYKDSDLIPKPESIQIQLELDHRQLPQMYGWYAQQFIKIRLISQLADNELALIWDGDTIPLRPLQFQRSGKILHFVGNEYHEPYFQTLHNSLGITKQTPHSFISQCFPLRPLAVKKFIAELGGEQWILNTLRALSDTSDCRFSEYESLGNFILARQLYDIEFLQVPWERNGAKYYYRHGSLEQACESLKFYNNFAAFEKIQDPPTTRLVKNGLKRLANLFHVSR
jgi:hypothetical protein